MSSKAWEKNCAYKHFRRIDPSQENDTSFVERSVLKDPLECRESGFIIRWRRFDSRWNGIVQCIPEGFAINISHKNNLQWLLCLICITWEQQDSRCEQRKLISSFSIYHLPWKIELKSDESLWISSADRPFQALNPVKIDSFTYKPAA